MKTPQDVYARSIELHDRAKGKIEIVSKVPLRTQEDLSLAYTPGVAEPCRAIEKDPSLSFRYTSRWNTVAVVTDGSAVLGLGDIGAAAAMPVMEGKAILFKEFGGVDAFPIAIASKDVDEIVRTVELISPGFGGINLEDISGPRCFLIEQRLRERLDIPVFHDDQHGTAVVTLAALFNALEVTGKKIGEVRIVLNGAGAAGICIVKFLYQAGARRIILCDREGAIYPGRRENMNFAKQDVTRCLVDAGKLSLGGALEGADVFIGVSGPGLVTADMVRGMNKDAIIFAMANPVPEIMPDDARKAGAAVVGTGRSDFPNQINNLLAFPGIFRGTFDAGAKAITEGMKIAASRAIAACVPATHRSPDCIIPSALDRGVAKAVAAAVAGAARAR